MSEFGNKAISASIEVEVELRLSLAQIYGPIRSQELLKSVGQNDPPPHAIEGPAYPMSERVKGLK